MRGPLQERSGDEYERPNQPWLCGLSEDGLPCPLGPMPGGRCPHSAACHPVRDGDHWHCNRSIHRGGPCEPGPNADGVCCQVYQCTPLRSLRARRGRFVFYCSLATIGMLAMALSAGWRNEVLAPGPLTVHHAQLVAREEASLGCASCHAAGNQTVAQWMRHVTDDSLAAPTQTTLCMNCHERQFPLSAARWAHNVDPQVLLAGATALDSRTVDPRRQLACAACHREHHGADFDLTRMHSTTCQACHQEQFKSFAGDHPEFDAWPAAKPTPISFDHASHQAKHFVKEGQPFACSKCHAASHDGAFETTLAYEVACQACHDAGIRTTTAGGIPLVRLPMVDVAALADAGRNVGPWPAAASEEFDGPLPPLFKLLLLGDPQGRGALEALGVDFDFFDVDSADVAQLAAAADAIEAAKRLLAELQAEGQPALKRQIEQVLQRELTDAEFAPLAGRLSPASLAVVESWWTAEEPDAQSTAAVAAGGWTTSPLTLELAYHPTGHADPWLTAWINALAEAAAGPQQSLARPLLDEVFAPTSAGQCASCHRLKNEVRGKLAVAWQTTSEDATAAGFTHFSHAPHVLQAELADCTACHRLDATSTAPSAGFAPITRADCAVCHTPHAAGDNCTQCHRYHANRVGQ